MITGRLGVRNALLKAVSQPVRSILIIRLSAIGDIVMASPLARALRVRYPDAHIAWMVQPEAKALLEANPDLNEVIVWPRGEWRKLWRERRWVDLIREIKTFARRLRSRRFDLVIDAQGLLKSGIWAWLSGAPNRIGLRSKEGSQWLMSRVLEKPASDKRIGSEYLHLAEELGLDTKSFDMRVALTPEDEAFAAELVRKEGLERGYAVICPFTTRPQKHWVEERWPELAARVHEKLGLRAVMPGGPGDIFAAQRITDVDTGHIVNVTGKTTLRQAAALIRGSSLLVGVDTGLTHMGIAFNIPTLVLFGSTCPYTDTRRDNAVVLYKKLECSPCKRNPTCGGRYPCMTSITVDEVLATAQRLLA